VKKTRLEFMAADCISEFAVRCVAFLWDPDRQSGAFAVYDCDSTWTEFESWQDGIAALWPLRGWPLPWAPDDPVAQEPDLSDPHACQQALLVHDLFLRIGWRHHVEIAQGVDKGGPLVIPAVRDVAPPDLYSTVAAMTRKALSQVARRPDVDAMGDAELLALCKKRKWPVFLYPGDEPDRTPVLITAKCYRGGTPGEPWDLAALREAVRKALDAEGVARDV